MADGVFVTTKSAWVAVATTSAAVAELFPELESLVVDVTVAVSLIAVPAAVPAVTCRTSVKLDDPGAKVELLHVIVPVPPTTGVVHDHPAGVEIDRNVVFGGVFSVIAADAALLGPPFVTTCV